MDLFFAADSATADLSVISVEKTWSLKVFLSVEVVCVRKKDLRPTRDIIIPAGTIGFSNASDNFAIRLISKPMPKLDKKSGETGTTKCVLRASAFCVGIVRFGGQSQTTMS